MSRGNTEVVRQRVAARPRSRRVLEERLGLRFPAVLAFLSRAVWRLPPRSRLRQAILRRAVELGSAALDREDYEAAFGTYDAHVELIVPRQFVTLGFDIRYRGRQERIDFQRRWTAEWGAVRFEPEEVIDLGDGRMLVISRMRGSGLGSGATVDNEWANLFTFSAGRVIREQAFADHAEALEAAGLRE